MDREAQSVAPHGVERYLRGGPAAEVQRRPAVVVRRLLFERGIAVPLRTLQRVLMPHRRARLAAEVATVRFETAPGHQMQIDFGEKPVTVAGALARVYLFVAVLGYSRRLFTRASLSQRQDDWREGLAAAFRHFGGVPQALLLDNAGALVVGRDREAGKACLHPAFEAFCRDWASKRGCASRTGLARRRDGVGGRADRRVHGTTHERPCDRLTARSAPPSAGESAAGTAAPGLEAGSHRLLRGRGHDPLQRAAHSGAPRGRGARR